ncbi:MAG TPA: carboxypeptidase-like regulatory domain-containing protein [Acidobacteriaceae bacterium]
MIQAIRRETSGCLNVLFLLTATLILFASTLAHAQTGQGSITGRVTDTRGAVVQNAKVTVTNNDTHVSITTLTNQDGLYMVRSLNPATYTVNVTNSGFEQSVTNNVTIGAAQQPAIDVTLHVGSTSQEVTVEAMNALLSSGTSEVTTTVDRALVEDLPYPERSSLEAALLVPGVNGDPSVPGGVFSENPPITTGPVVPGASISMGGGPPGTGSIVIDGSDVTQGSYARAGISLSGKNIAETTVITSGLSARYGRTSAGIIVQVSRAGTNNYHGAVTWRHTDPFFNAVPLGTTARNAQHENFYGFYVGGPVYIPKLYHGRNRTFFYAAVEPARVENTFSYRGQLPTSDDVAGRLHNTYVLLNQTILKSSGYAAALAAPRLGPIDYQTTVNAQGFPNSLPFNSSSLYQEIMGPSGPDDLSLMLAQNPLAKFVMANLPSPANPGPYVRYDYPDGSYSQDLYNATYQRNVQNIDNRYSIRLDHQFSNIDQIYVRYTVVPLNAPRSFALAIDNPLSGAATDTTTSHDLALGYTHIFHNTLVSNFHYSFLRVNQQRLPPASSLTKDFASAFGLTPSALGKGFSSLGTLYGSLQVANVTAYADIDQNFIVGDDLTWSHGKHLFQFGGESRWIQSNEYDNSSSYGGKYGFSASQTNNGSSGGSALATFILGTISSYTATPVAIPAYYRWHYYAGYLQDDWRIAAKLTLNLGIRYEVETPRREKFNNQAFLQLNTPGSVNGIPTTSAFCFSGECGTGRGIWPTNWYGLEPRIGISYAATQHMTIRAFYGMMRLPLTGYGNLPNPNLNVSSQAITSLSGGTSPNIVTNYMTNPVGPLTSAFTALNGSRGPIAYSTGLDPVYVEQNSAVPSTQAYSFTIQYQPGAKTLLQFSYQGLKGTHLIGAMTGSLNVPDVPTLVNAVQTQQLLGGSGPNSYGITQNGVVVKESNLQKLNPYQNFFNATLAEIFPRIGNSSYNAFYASMNHRMGHGLSLLAFYSWSKSIDNVPDTNPGNSGTFGSAPMQNPLDTSGERSVSTFDQPSRLKVGYTYQLPIGRGKLIHTNYRWLDTVIGDWSTSGIATEQSGFPLFVTLGSTGYFMSFTPPGVNGCATGVNYCSASALPTGYQLRPDIVPGVPLINPGWKKNPFGLNGQAATPYLNAAAFSVPGSLGNPALGNAPRTLSGARSARETLFDMQVRKWFTLTPRYRFGVFGTFSNVFNHPVYFPGNTTVLQTTSTACTQATPNAACAGYAAPSIKFNASGSFGNVGTNTAQLSRIIRVGAEFDF